MNSRGKRKVNSLILLSAIFLQLMSSSPNLFATAAPPPQSSTSGGISSGTPTSNEMLLPPSKITAGSNPADSNTNDTSQSNFGSQQQLSSVLENELVTAAAASMAAGNNAIAHQNQHGETTAVKSASSSRNGIGEMSKVASGRKVSSFVDFPPYTKPMSTQPRYQRQRRSYPMPNLNGQDLSSSSYHFTRPDELELRLDDERDRDAFIKLMALLAADNNNNRPSGLNDDLTSLLLRGEGDNDDGDEDTSIDLGTFQRPVGNPYWNSMLSGPESINLMSSLLEAESPRANSPHGLPLDMGLVPRASSIRDDDSNDGEWYEDPVPLRGSHFKTRRSGTEFTYNPVKSHFRRYMRAVPLKSGRGLEFIPNGGRFGPIVSRRRRATSVGGGSAPAMHWM